MSRTIKALGATLAVVAAMATPAAAQGPTFGFDFNPTVDKIRVTSAAAPKQNLLHTFSERRPDRVESQLQAGPGGADGGSLDSPRFLYASIASGNDTVDVTGLDNVG